MLRLKFSRGCCGCLCCCLSIGCKKCSNASSCCHSASQPAAPHPILIPARHPPAPQDVLLVSYLANLVRTQVALAEKLGTAQLPLV